MKSFLVICLLALFSLSTVQLASAKTSAKTSFSYQRIDWAAQKKQLMQVQYSDDKVFSPTDAKTLAGTRCPFTVIIRDTEGRVIAFQTFSTLIWGGGPGIGTAIVSREHIVDMQSDWYKNTDSAARQRAYKEWDRYIAANYRQHKVISWKFKNYLQYIQFPMETDLGTFSKTGTGFPQTFCTRSRTIGKYSLYTTKPIG